MTAQVENTPEGYIVSVFYDLNNDGYYHWYRLRNFGTHEGDAKAFKDYDVPKLSDPQIKSLIRNFDVTRKYTRIDCRHFKAQS